MTKRKTTAAKKHRKLTDVQREFCRLYVEYSNATRAYREAYGKSSEVKESTCRSNASKLLTNTNILTEIERIRSEIDKAAVLSLQEKRKFLANVIRTPIHEVDRDSPLCQTYEYSSTNDGSKEIIKMPSKLEAIKIDNDMMGHGNKRLELTGKDGNPLSIEVSRTNEENADFAAVLAAELSKIHGSQT